MGVRFYLTVGENPEEHNGPVRGGDGRVLDYATAAEAGAVAREMVIKMTIPVPVFVQKLVPVAMYMPVHEGEAVVLEDVTEQEDGRVEN